MTKKEVQKIKNKITEMIGTTEQHIVELKEATKPISPDNAIGRITRMDAINNKSVSEAALRKTRVKLEKLQRNLERIQKNEFGLCTRCGKEIQVARLLYVPETSWCIQCARRG